MVKGVEDSCAKPGVHVNNCENDGIANGNSKKDSKTLFIANNLMCKIHTIFQFYEIV
jgi:hypothetical protein